MITGSGGFVGFSLLAEISELNPIGVAYRFLPNFGRITTCDLRNINEVKKLFDKIEPKTVFHLAALPNPSINDKNKKLARESNVGITENIISNLKDETHQIFTSTDIVFDGTHPCPNEDTPTRPNSFHGELKVECENIIKMNVKKYHILRLSTIHSMDNSSIISTQKRVTSFINYSLERIRLREKVEAFDNVKRCFCRLNELNQLLKFLINDNHYGIYNVGSPMTSYYDRIRILCEENSIPWERSLVRTEGFAHPIEQNLNTSKLQKTFNFSFS